MKETHVTHEFIPIVDHNTKILILGSFPSVKSRENAFYYGHPQNRFWKLLASILECDVPATIEEKKEMLRTHGVGIWDVIESCDITGSSDSSIRNVVPAKIPELLSDYPNIQAVFANGRLAEKLYKKYIDPRTEVRITALPSTSPANAAYSLDRLREHWEKILIHLDDKRGVDG
ncbi:MAG: DNA-deoxyinosine glycosylase [Lachnospiraceae bacterium]|nr:DNA-deoxyinosine glycosylase [Lachnospiraceae bacterium]